MNDAPSIESIVQAALQPAGDLAAALKQLGRSEIRTKGEARSIAWLITAWERMREEDPKPFSSTFHAVTAFFQQARSAEAVEALRELALPTLLRAYDARLSKWSPAAKPGWDGPGNDLLFALKIFAMYGGEEPIERIVAAARRPLSPDGFTWSVVFQSLAAREEALLVIGRIQEPLPPGLLGVLLLDKCNELARAGKLAVHPFDNDAGVERMRGWLTKPGEHDSYCVSAIAAIPFLSPVARSVLLELAATHPKRDVQMQLAWARAHLGDERGTNDLVAWAGDARTSVRAVAYLKELGKESAVPRRDANFTAMSEMCKWLAHPNEFGRPPDEIELFDHRTLPWPPTNDRRSVWLFRYRYEKNDGSVDEGIGMVGSTTFALFGETTAAMSPEDVYALHCAWELEMKRDPRAPAEKRSIVEGRALLGFPPPPGELR